MAHWSRWTILLTGCLALILIPFFLWGEQIEHASSTFLASSPGRWTAAAVITGLLAADIVLPIPSSIVSTAAGAVLGFPAGLAASWTGMTAACAAGYTIGSSARAVRLLPPAEFDRVRAARDRYGDWALVLFRPIPVLAEASVLFAGLTGSGRTRFLALTSLANLGVSAVYSAAGASASARDAFPYAFLAAVALPGFAMWLGRRR